MEQILCNILNAFKGCPSFPFLYLAPNVTLSVHTRHTYSHIGYIRHVYQIIFCVFILYGYTWWKNISKRSGLGGDWCTQTTRILLWWPFDKYWCVTCKPYIRSSGQLLYAYVFIYDFVMFILSVRCDQIQWTVIRRDTAYKPLLYSVVCINNITNRDCDSSASEYRMIHTAGGDLVEIQQSNR